MRFIYCDAALQNDVGHFAAHCRLISSGLRELGVAPIVLGHQAIEGTLAKEVDARGFFSTSPYTRTSDDPVAGWLKTFSDVSSVFAADFGRLEGLASDDVVFYDTCTPGPLAGLIAWAQGKFKPENCPRIVVALIEHSGLLAEWLPDGSRRLVAGASDAMLYRFASLSLAQAYASCFRFISYDRLVAEAYVELTRRRVVQIPHPWPATTPPRDRRTASPVCVAFIGAQRENKGFNLVPDIARRLLERLANVRVIVQNSWGFMAPEMTRLAEVAARETRLELIHGAKDPAGWADLLARCDLLVAPYDRRQYAVACSGITFEGFANGIPVVVPTRTAMESALGEYADAGIAFESVTTEGVVAAIEQALSQYAELATRAQDARKLWGERNGPRHVAEALLRVARDPD